MQYGLSLLHSWIKLFECVLHSSYRQDIRIHKIEDNKRNQNSMKGTQTKWTTKGL